MKALHKGSFASQVANHSWIACLEPCLPDAGPPGFIACTPAVKHRGPRRLGRGWDFSASVLFITTWGFGRLGLIHVPRAAEATWHEVARCWSARVAKRLQPVACSDRCPDGPASAPGKIAISRACQA